MASGERPKVLSIAPMIQWSDRHWRFLIRRITREALLYTEMIMDNALVHNVHNLEVFLGHEAIEHPLAVQLGGCDPERLGEAAYLCQSFAPFHEINLNSGCPSNKAKKAGFGAELMLEPTLVRRIVHEMQRRATASEITVKCRIGVTGRESWDDLKEYVGEVRLGGVRRMIIHARSCVLHGLSPAQNRSIPPLHPEVVHQLVRTFPDMTFVLNGGLSDWEISKQHLGWTRSSDASSRLFHADSLSSASPSTTTAAVADDSADGAVHGVMIGREAYNHPFHLSTVDSEFFGRSDRLPSRSEVVEEYLDYASEAQHRQLHGSRCCTLVKPLHNIFHGCPTNHLYKQNLDALLCQHSKHVDKGEMELRELIHQAIEETIPADFLDLRGWS